MKVVSAHDGAIPDALVRLDVATDHDLARYTDPDGCADFRGVVGPARSVRVSITKPGFQTRSLKLAVGQEKCFVVHLGEDGQPQGFVETPALQGCPCASDRGYSPTLAARFVVTSNDGTRVRAAVLRRTDRARTPWLEVTDASGCLGVTWIVPAGGRTIPIVLEKDGYQSMQLEVPVMQEHCYAVTLSRTDDPQPSTVTNVDLPNCQCAMFAGQTVWPEK
jgi:hypothetical protein